MVPSLFLVVGFFECSVFVCLGALKQSVGKKGTSWVRLRLTHELEGYPANWETNPKKTQESQGLVGTHVFGVARLAW